MSFKGETLDLACTTPGGDAKEPLDFEQDFLAALSSRPNEATVRKVPVHVGYLTSCNAVLGAAMFIPPIQVEAGEDRQGDEGILVKALIDIGINKKDIVPKSNGNKVLLVLTIGPKAQ